MGNSGGQLKELCDGRVDKVITRVDIISDDKIRLQLTADLMDPLSRMSDLKFDVVLEAEAGDYKKDGDELRRSKPLSVKSVKPVSMTEDKDIESRASGSIELSGKANEKQQYVVQLSFKNQSGERVYLKPLVRTIEFGDKLDEARAVVEVKLDDQFSAEDEFGNSSAFGVGLEEVATGFAFNDETGDLAVIDTEAGVVRRYTMDYLNGDDDQLEDPVEVGQRPVSICFKRFRGASFYAVACYGDERIYLIDSKTFKVIEKIGIDHSDVTLISSSLNPQDPNLYYAFGSKNDSGLGRLNLETRKNSGKIIDDVMDFAISTSGRYLYRRGPRSPSGFDCFEFDQGFEDQGFRQIVDEHRSTQQYVPGPFDSYTATGNDLHSVDLKRKIASVDFDVMCFFDDRPVIVGITREKSNIIAASLNTLRRFGSVKLPKGFSKILDRPDYIPVSSNGNSLRIKYQLRMFADKRFNRLILAYRNQLLLIPLSTFGVVEEPFFLAEITAPNEAIVDRESKILIRPIDPGVTVEVKNRPESMQMIKGGFVWTPGVEEYGEQRFELEYTHEDLTRSGFLPIRVSRPHVGLPFTDIGGINIYAEHSAVCWGNKEARESIAIVDLKTHEVVHHHKFSFEVKHAAIDDRFVYVLPHGSSLLLVLDRENYSEHKRVFTSNPGEHVQSTGETVVLTNAGGSYSLYDIPDFKLRASYKGTGQQFRSRLLPVQVDGNWRLGNRVFDRELKKPILYQPDRFNVVQLEGVDYSSGMIQFSSWGRYLEGEALKSATNRVVGTLSSRNSVIVDGKPLAASLIVDVKSNVTRVEIALHDVASGQFIRKVPMTEVSKRLSNYELVLSKTSS